MITSVDGEAVNELVNLVREGSFEAGPFLVSLCGARLTKYVNLIAPDMSEREREVICETAVERAVQRIEKFDPTNGTFDAWLRGFVRFVVKERRHRGYGGREIATDPANLPEPSPSRDSDVNSLAAPLTTAMLTLSETDQMIIRLRDFEAVPYSEIAELLKVREPATRQRHARALKKLRAALLEKPEFKRFIEED